jgi:CubicO group peptidase (beta-lactamase class C family)
MGGLTRVRSRVVALVLCSIALVGCKRRVSEVTASATLSPSASAHAAAAAAARAVADQNPSCTELGAFYWEIGDVEGAIASGSRGVRFSASTRIDIASASKMVWGAYVLERFRTQPDKIDLRAMRMLSGHTDFTNCVGAETVSSCCAKRGASGGTNCALVASEVDHYHYGGGHFEAYAMELGLGALDSAELASEYRKVLGIDPELGFKTPQPAGGMESTAEAYAHFLRRVLSGALALGHHLGEHAVCAHPGDCPAADFSPVPEDWHYSYGHWVEDDPRTGDGSFSSPGAFGFYPWIDRSKRFYGILARESAEGVTGPTERTPYWRSVECGRAIRRAFLEPSR